MRCVTHTSAAGHALNINVVSEVTSETQWSPSKSVARFSLVLSVKSVFMWMCLSVGDFTVIFYSAVFACGDQSLQSMLSVVPLPFNISIRDVRY